MKPREAVMLEMHTVCLLLLFIVKCVVNEEILGCGGFVKSDVSIDFSQIEIQLLTSEGMLKYQTECAPNNGYYMVPFVEKGNFILRIDPPKGWLFEPMTVELKVDGINDDCSKGKDINFVFKGFTVTGQVSSLGSSSMGPRDVKVELKSLKDEKVIDTTTSLSGGMFKFDGVSPGQYLVVASHQTYSFSKPSISVTVSDGNVKCKEDIVVSGYDIKGKVSAQSLPVTGVRLLLFTTSKLAKQVAGCSLEKPQEAKHITCEGYPVFVCVTTSSGDYTFSNLPPAQYAIVPFHKGERMQFDIEPTILKVTLSSSHVDEKTDFIVTGYSVQGRLLHVDKGKPVEGALILVNGEQRSVTNKDGYYTIKHKHTGSAPGAMLEVVVKKKDLKFPVKKVRVDPDTPILPTIIAESFSVCGRVEITAVPAPNFTPELIVVEIVGSGKTVEIQKINLDKNAQFCFMKSPGEYNLKIIISKSMENQGLVLQPPVVKVSVKDQPIKNILFTQYQASISIRVSCIADCKDVNVELSSEQTNRKKMKVAIAKKTNDTSVKFDGVLPGEYTVRVSHNDWCWVSDAEKITVPKFSTKEEAPLAEFKQSGFVLVCSISHDIEMVIHHAGEKLDPFSLKKGRNRLCLSSLGEYTLEPRSCHRFDVQSPIVYNTAHPKPIHLHAIAHEAVIAMEANKAYEDSPLKEDKIQVEIRSSRGKVTKEYLTLSKEPAVDSKDTVVYKVSYWASDGEKLEIIPTSKLLIFDPLTSTATMHAGGCSAELVRFKGIVGTFITGQITPPLGNVHITIAAVNSEATPILLKTGKDGKYKVGPLHPDMKYTISAALEDYVLTPVPEKQSDFVAKKLSKLLFKITLEDEGTPLPGVLLSISGGDYRSNNLTGAEGSLALTKLEPGQYYFKAIMKEYKFKPPSQVIEIVEGAKTEINIVGKRVAFSIYGEVTSLNGEPESGTLVRALALPDEDTCTGLGEEGTTGSDGAYRIRGLRPQCVYNVTVHDGTNRFSRLSPEQVKIAVEEKDVNDVKFIAFRPVSGFELSGYIVTSAEFLPHIKVLLYKAGDGASTTPVQTLSLTRATPFFYLAPLPRDESEYFLRLECSLPTSRYDYSPPGAGFFAVGPHKHITIRFAPQLKPIEPDTPHVSVLSLPITLLVIFLAYNYSQVLAFLQQVYQLATGKRESADNSFRNTRKARK